jgi:hypothetical protein
LAAGRYKGLFTKLELESLNGPFITHPLSIIKKDTSSKPQLVEDLSFPHSEDSINSLTNVSGMLLDWAGLTECIDIMVTTPEGTQAALLDIEHAYRTIGITPSEFWLSVIQDNYEIFLADLAAKLGGKSCCFNFDLPARAFCTIIVQTFAKLKAPQWVDDMMPIRSPLNPLPPYVYSANLKDICDLSHDLGFSFAAEKMVEFGPMAKYLGFLWSWDTREVLVPEDKGQSTSTQ